MDKIILKVLRLIKKSHAGEKGQVILALALILMLIIGLILPPLLNFISTSIKAHTTLGGSVNELYSADAGVEDALWHIRYNHLSLLTSSASAPYDEYDFTTLWSRNWSNPALSNAAGTGQVNKLDVDYTLQNIWIPIDIPTPDPTLASNIINDAKLAVSDTDAGPNPADLTGREGIHNIRVTYQPDADDTLYVNSIGIWLPSGFDFSLVSDTDPHDQSTNPIKSNIYDGGGFNLGNALFTAEVISDHAGNKAIVWSFEPPTLFDSTFPGYQESSGSRSIDIQFMYERPLTNLNAKPDDAIAWITTSGTNVSDIPYSWNDDIKIFKITSAAGSTTVTSYNPKAGTRHVGAAKSGDYYATGNSLMRDAIPSVPDYHIRETWVHTDSAIAVNSSSNTVDEESSPGAGDGIPTDANVTAAFLYWTAWYHENAKTAILSDDCSTFDNWDWVSACWSMSSDQFAGRGASSANTAERTLTLKNSLDLSSYPSGLVSVTWDQSLSPAQLESGDAFYYALSGNGGSTWSSNIEVFHDDSPLPTTPFTFTVPDTYLTNNFKIRFYLNFDNPAEYVYLDNIKVVRTIFSDDGSNFNDWDKSSGGGNQTRVPTADGDISNAWDLAQIRVPTGDGDVNPASGTWTASTGSKWDTLNESPLLGSPATDTDYVTGSNAAAGTYYQLFTFGNFTVPSGATITNVTVYQKSRDNTSGTNNIYCYVKVGGSYYNCGTAHNPGTTATWYNNVWTNNPKTLGIWTVDDVNGNGANPLQQIGVYSTDLSPAMRTTQLFVVVNYTFTGNRFQNIDETAADDTDVMVGTTNAGGYQLFTSAPFTVPTSSDITNLTIYYRACDYVTTAATNNIRAVVKVGGTLYNTTIDSGSNPGIFPATYSCTITNNPKTGLPWTADEINGVGTNALQQFGVYSNDLFPDVAVSMVYAQVTYDSESRWTISSGQFAGQGSTSATTAQRTITLKTGLDLHSYSSVDISWNQTVSGGLESGDALYYALSGNGGTSWSPNYEVFHDDSPTPTNPNTITITDTNYLTTNFKIRFYLNFDATAEYIYLDNIRIVRTIFSNDCSDMDDWSRSADTSFWTISGNEFQGEGNTGGTTIQRTMALKNGIDLSTYPSGSVSITWDQREGGALESTDTLYYALSGDGGTTWSTNIEVFHDNSPANSFALILSDTYITNSFKIRFYFNFNDPAESVYLDNIKITAMVPNTAAKIKFDSGSPLSITPDRTEIIPNIISGTPTGFSYACFKDVTDMVLANTRADDGLPGNDGDLTNDIFYPGIATYTVGGIGGTLGNDSQPADGYQMAHAGWSLILIYSSPTTQGHQLYLFDKFSFADDYENLDFDNDGIPGGDVTGFYMPERIYGVVSGISVTNGGSGYTSVPTVNISAPDIMGGAQAMATAAISGGHVTGINITYEGSGYRLLHPPTVTITGGNGTGATVTITVDETVGETNAAKMTVMVGEGDEFITGDYLAFKGTTLWDGTTSNGNSSSSPNNVWNGKSTLFNADGIDVDTFTITWASGLLHHGDTSANIDMYTAQDNWNLVFIILSFRSSVATGDSLAYLITRH